jgi:hypothetical protein
MEYMETLQSTRGIRRCLPPGHTPSDRRDRADRNMPRFGLLRLISSPSSFSDLHRGQRAQAAAPPSGCRPSTLTTAGATSTPTPDPTPPSGCRPSTSTTADYLDPDTGSRASQSDSLVRCSSPDGVCGNAAMAHRDDEGGSAGGGWRRGLKDAHRLKHRVLLPAAAAALLPEVSPAATRCDAGLLQRTLPAATSGGGGGGC